MLLVPMTEPEYQLFAERSVGAYAAARVAAGEWGADRSLHLAAKEFHGLLPDGLATPGHHLFTLRVEAGGPPVGTIWYAEQLGGRTPTAFLYDIEILPAFQRRGYGMEAMLALEADVVRRGLTGIGLRVFGHNRTALALYERAGYVATSIAMFKPLAG